MKNIVLIIALIIAGHAALIADAELIIINRSAPGGEMIATNFEDHYKAPIDVSQINQKVVCLDKTSDECNNSTDCKVTKSSDYTDNISIILLISFLFALKFR